MDIPNSIKKLVSYYSGISLLLKWTAYKDFELNKDFSINPTLDYKHIFDIFKCYKLYDDSTILTNFSQNEMLCEFFKYVDKVL